nr:Radial spoke head protein 4 A [Polyrhizophydium stewartii]
MAEVESSDASGPEMFGQDQTIESLEGQQAQAEMGDMGGYDTAAMPDEMPSQPVAEAEEDTSIHVGRFSRVGPPPPKKEMSHMPEDTEFVLARSFLSSKVGGRSFSLYEHLTSIVGHVLETRSQSALENFETLSADLKRSRFQSDVPGVPTTLREVVIPGPDVELAKKQAVLFKRLSAEEAAEKASSDLGEVPDIMDLAHLWEWAGVSIDWMPLSAAASVLTRTVYQVSFGPEETFLLLLSIKKLIEDKPLKSVRLWGKIFGTHGNYIIVEAELKDGATDEDEATANAVPEDPHAAQEAAEAAAAQAKAAAAGGGSAEDEEGSRRKPMNPEEDETGLPKPKSKTINPLSREVHVGVNRYNYYVCPYAGADWIVSYPAFDGTEAQYLRAQIARITAATVLSPNGYYMVDNDDGESEESNAGASIIVNPEFEGFANDQLLNLANWVHHMPYILPQGRVTWENPAARGENADGGDDEDRDDDEGSESNGAEAVEPETGPTLLSVISADEDHGDIPSWTARLCSPLSPSKYSPVMLRSTRWPGAAVVSYNDKFANIYVGFGLKDLGSPVQRFVPPRLPEIQREYATGEGAEGNAELLLEQLDPTIEQEKAFEDEKKAKEAEGKEGGEDAEDAGDEEAEED